jgi:cytochrome c-type biogenesis protein CcmH
VSPVATSRRGPAAWIILAVVVVVALAIGWSSPHVSSPAARAQQIDASLRCPSCDGISVAASSAATAVTIRNEVLTRVHAGQSTEEIDAYFESRYGGSILLAPPTSGVSGLVWIVPLVAGAAGLGGLATVFWRRRRVVPQTVTAEDRALVARALDEVVAQRDMVAGSGQP